MIFYEFSKIEKSALSAKRKWIFIFLVISRILTISHSKYPFVVL